MLRRTLCALLPLALAACKARQPLTDDASLKDEFLRTQGAACYHSDLMTIHNATMIGEGGHYVTGAAKAVGFDEVEAVTIDPNEGNQIFGLDNFPSKAYVMLSRQKETILVVFRGSHSVIDWHFNAMAAPTFTLKPGVLVHTGFNGAALIYLQDVAKAIARLKKVAADAGKKARVVMTGHSLGGAIATMTGYHLDGDTDEVVVYGAPRVGLRLNHAYKRGGAMIHYLVKGDIVTEVPPKPYEELPGQRVVLPYVENAPEETLLDRGRNVASDALDAGYRLVRLDFTGAKQVAKRTIDREIGRHFPGVYVDKMSKLCLQSNPNANVEFRVGILYRRVFGIAPSEARVKELAQRLTEGRLDDDAFIQHLFFVDREYRERWVKSRYEFYFETTEVPKDELDEFVGKIKKGADFDTVEADIAFEPRALAPLVRRWLKVFGIGKELSDAEVRKHVATLKSFGERAVARKPLDIVPDVGARLAYTDDDLRKGWVRTKNTQLRRGFAKLQDPEKTKRDKEILDEMERFLDPRDVSWKWSRAFAAGLCLVMRGFDAFEQTIDTAYATAGAEITDAERKRWIDGLPAAEIQIKAEVEETRELWADAGGIDDSTTSFGEGSPTGPFMMTRRGLQNFPAKMMDQQCGNIMRLHRELAEKIAAEKGAPLP